jgi:hypothetical protein
MLLPAWLPCMSSLLSSFEITDENTDETINIDVVMAWINNIIGWMNNAGRMQEFRRRVCRYDTDWPERNLPKRTQSVTD